MRLKHSKLMASQTSRLCEHFVAGTPARTAAKLVALTRTRPCCSTTIVCCCRLGGIGRIAELRALRLAQGEGGSGALGDLPALLFRERCIEVEHEGIVRT